MKMLVYIFFCICSLAATAQSSRYTASNAHSHNDYEQPVPFHDAYNAGFGSIEADIFLVAGSEELLVAHTTEELRTKKRRLDSLYLLPLVNCIRKNHGSVYPDKSKKLQILVDVKTTAVPTIARLVETIRRYPELTNTPSLQFTISGNRPDPGVFASYPPFITFDGELQITYSSQALSRVTLMSADLKKYTLWNGYGPVPAQDSVVIKMNIDKCHALHKPIRFWDAPDHPEAWNWLMAAGVDFINTDKISTLAEFLK
jgi:hypothetical protein